MEFKHLYSRKEGQRPENRTKNRYKNILPCRTGHLAGEIAAVVVLSAAADPLRRNPLQSTTPAWSSRMWVPKSAPTTSTPTSLVYVGGAAVLSPRIQRLPHPNVSLTPQLPTAPPPSPSPPSPQGEVKASKNAYIACQGCLKATIPAFWQMIWENNSRVVVMTTKVVERGKVCWGRRRIGL